MATGDNVPKISTANSGHFVTTANGMFPDAGSPSTQSQDYYNWGWKEIEAAIDGGSELIGPEAEAEAKAFSNPQTLWDAADVFENVRLVLGTVASVLLDQATALAHGSDAPWQGDAADAFFNSVSLFAAQVKANFEVLNGGSTGLHNVPVQLNQAGSQLAQAQLTVQEIDTFYANMASIRGAQTGSGGLVHVSQYPAIAYAMTEDMLQYALLPLAHVYTVAIDSIQPPNPSNFTTGNPNGLGGPNFNPNSPGAFNFHLPQFNFPNSQPNSPGAFNFHLPQFNFPNSPGANSPLGGNFHMPPVRAATSPGPNSPFGPNSPLGANSPLGSNFQVPPFHPATSAGPNAGLPQGQAPAALSALSPAAFPPGAVPAAPLAGLSGSPRSLVNGPIQPIAGLKAFSPAANSLRSPAASLAVPNVPLVNRALSPAASAGVPLAAFPGAPLANRAASPLAASPNAALAGLPNVPLVNRALSPVASMPNLPLANQALSPAAGAQAPFLPFLPGMGQAANGLGGSGLPSPTDASGLIGGQRAFSPNAPLLADEVGANGALPGGASLAGLGGRKAFSPLAGAPNLTSPAGAPLSAAGTQAPFLPFLPGMGQGAAGAGGAAPEPTDASGLLGGQRAFSPNAPVLADEVGANGALPGGASLAGLGGPGSRKAVSPLGGEQFPAVSAAGQPGAASAPFFPFLPGMGQGAAGAGGAAPEPTDASGLLGGQRAFSPNAPVLADEVGANGALPGGASLAGLGEARRAVSPLAGAPNSQAANAGIVPGAQVAGTGGAPGEGLSASSGAEGLAAPGAGLGDPGSQPAPFFPFIPGTGAGGAALSGIGGAPPGEQLPLGPDDERAMRATEPGNGQRGDERKVSPASGAARPRSTDAEDIAAWGAGSAAAWILTGSGRGPAELPYLARDPGLPPEGDGPPYLAPGDESEAGWAGTGLVGWRRASGDSRPATGEYPYGERRPRATSQPYEEEEIPVTTEEEDEPEDEADRIGNLLIEESTLWGLPAGDLGDLG